MRILIVEDEKNIADPLKKGLERQSFAVDLAYNGNDGFEMASINKYDCIVLDLNLPGMDGIEVCDTLRKKGVDIPILILTARSALDEKITGLENGADDYLTKPFSFKELVLRINALIKRYHPIQTATIKVNEITLDSAKHSVMLDSKKVILNRKEFGILEYLMRNKDRVVSQEELLEHVWNQEVDLFTNTVRTQIRNLRKKIDPEKEIIETIRGVGYKIKDDR